MRRFVDRVDGFGGAITVAFTIGWLAWTVPAVFDVRSVLLIGPWDFIAAAVVLVTLWYAKWRPT